MRRPVLTDCPRPPSALLPWLQPGWQEVSGSVTWTGTLTEHNADGQLREIRFEDDEERVRLRATWEAQRNRWLETERPARQVMQLFERLYALQARIERESEQVELVLGDGLLEYNAGGQAVQHPVLLQRLELQFDPSVPEFTLLETEHPPELYTALLRALPEVSMAAIGRLRTELEEKGWHPLGGEETSSFLRTLVTQLSPHGVFGDQAGSERRDAPRVRRQPVVFLRSRSLGFSAAFERILEELPQRAEVPGWMTSIVGIDPAPVQASSAEERSSIA
ncbi:MAG: hypothetical protein M3328_16280, partial [Chloroflexota bacterium]|nr:hypothetical protein [Chloroflexota bacterium]